MGIINNRKRRRKVVKFKKRYIITFEGQVDTVWPEEYPYPLRSFDTMVKVIVQSTNDYRKSNNVTLEMIDE